MESVSEEIPLDKEEPIPFDTLPKTRIGGVYSSDAPLPQRKVYFKLEQRGERIILYLVDELGERIPGGNILSITSEGLQRFKGVNPKYAPFPLIGDRIRLDE